MHEKGKTLDLADRLKTHPYQIVGHLTKLWLWALQENDSGDVTSLSDSVLARASGWEGNAEEWVLMLIETKWIRRKKRRRFLSGWKRLVDPQLQALARKRQYYQEVRGGRDAGNLDPKQASIFHLNRQYYPTLPNRSQERSQSQRSSGRIRVSDEARKLIARYEKITASVDGRGHTTPTRTPAMLQRLLNRTPGIGAKIDRAMDHYEVELASDPPASRRFVITPYNWFGQNQRWREKYRPESPFLDPSPDAGGDTETDDPETSKGEDPDADLSAYHAWRNAEASRRWEGMTPDERRPFEDAVRQEIGTRASSWTPETLAGTLRSGGIRRLASTLESLEEWRQKQSKKA